MDDIITIIIPVYNVENYVEKCIKSVIEQTYKKLQIIIIDDGSKDLSWKICEHYSNIDNRIVFFRKENMGLSDTRNRGLDICEGKYVFFLDSDDFLPNDAIETLYKNILSNNADISIGRFLDCYSPSFQITDENLFEFQTEIYDKTNGLNTMLYNSKFTNAACNKLYNIKLFDGVRFPVGKLYEDLATTYKLFYKAEKVVYSNKYTYCYLRDRENSIMHKKFSQARMQALDYAEEIVAFAKKSFTKIKKAAISRLVMECIFILLELPNTNEFFAENKRVKKIINKYRFQCLLNTKVPLKQKMLMIASIFGRKFLMKIWNIKEKRKRVEK